MAWFGWSCCILLASLWMKRSTCTSSFLASWDLIRLAMLVVVRSRRFQKAGIARLSQTILQGREFWTKWIAVNLLLIVISPNPSLRNLVLGHAFARFLDWVQLIFRLPSSQLCRASEPGFLSKSNNSSIHWFTLPHYFFSSAKKERDIKHRIWTHSTSWNSWSKYPLALCNELTYTIHCPWTPAAAVTMLREKTFRDNETCHRLLCTFSMTSNALSPFRLSNLNSPYSSSTSRCRPMTFFLNSSGSLSHNSAASPFKGEALHVISEGSLG